MTLDVGDVHGTFALVGRARRVALRVRGRLGATRLVWRAVPGADPSTWSGALSVRGGGHHMHGKLALSRDASGGTHCGDAYFASDVMPKVLDPICAQCHVQGGVAGSAPFRVTVGDPAATELSARGEVDPTNPMQSKILLKPLGQLSHGGGERFAPGSPEDQVLIQWVTLLTASGCGAPGGPPQPTTGAGLYAANCASCHGADAGGGIGPSIRCALRVSDAVKTGRGTAMPSLPLTDAQIALVASYLDQLCTADGRTGSDLYAGNCLTCHGATAQGGQNGLGVHGSDILCDRDVSESVRNGEPPRMPSFAMTGPDLASLQSYLDGLCPTGTAAGGDLFVGNCGGCHGPDALGVTGKGPAVRCSKSVHDPVRNGAPPMPALPNVPDSEIARIQSFLDDLCPPGTAGGGELWTANCAHCHAPDGSGTATALDVRCATRVADALSRGRGAAMPAFPELAGTDLGALMTWLGLACTAGGRTGAELYAGNCAGCHGATANGGQNGLGVRGPGIACESSLSYQNIVSSGDDGMPSFPALSTGDVDAIVTWVNAQFCPGG
jgi:mono/diheme cytochrome c family protein